MPSTLGVVASAKYSAPPPIPTTGLQAWWDAADNSTFSFSSGAAVSQWRDKSGTGRHLTQGTVAFQPLRNSTQNTLTAVTFDGVDDYMQTASFTMPQPWTVCLATNLVSDPTHGFVSAIGTPNLCQIYAGAAGWLDIQTPADRNATGLTNTGPQTMTFIVNNPSGQIYLSGVLKRGAIDSGANGTTTGLYVGATAGLEAGYRLSGVLMEAIIYNLALTDPARQQVESYLKQKWGTL